VRHTAPRKPAAHAEKALVTAILEEEFPPGSVLPAERDLAVKLGVTRPTLREVIGRLERDGWLTVRHGKPTAVNDVWRSGGLNVVSGIVRHAKVLPPGFVPSLLELRLLISPAYARGAVERSPDDVRELLAGHGDLPETAAAFAAFDWRLHHRLTVASGNPLFTLILNGFAGFYERMARRYFRSPEARRTSRRFYADLLACAGRGDAAAAEAVTRAVMARSIEMWRNFVEGQAEAKLATRAKAKPKARRASGRAVKPGRGKRGTP
jgi:GntR family negative regulator for fad regulon and positive regulator of fabA